MTGPGIWEAERALVNTEFAPILLSLGMNVLMKLSLAGTSI